MKNQTIISEKILANMSDGVMTLDLKGEIVAFNPAASQIFGMDGQEVIGRKFAELFFADPGNDDFNEAILNAIYESSTSHERIVNVSSGEQKKVVALTTSFLRSGAGEDEERIGVIAVFSDITEVEKLRDAEKRLVEEVKEKHRELRDSYLKMEENNQELESALKKVQVVRIAATGLIIVLFLGLGFFLWHQKPGAMEVHAAAEGDPRIFKVEPREAAFSIPLSGTLYPLHVVNITAPFAGMVREFHVGYGEVVKEGQIILELDTSEMERNLREAKVAYIKASTQYQELETWESGAEVARARRSLSRAQLALDSQRKNLEETERLFTKGIVPETELDGTRQQYEGQLLDYQTAREELAATMEKGSEKNRLVARFEMENAQSKLAGIEDQLKNFRVKAPVSGIVIMPRPAGSEKEVRKVEKSGSFQQGDIMLAVGDLSGFSIKTKVDELDVTKIEEGQRVVVTGDAFPGLQLTGLVNKKSSQAGTSGDEGGVPSFDVIVNTTGITAEHREKVFVGMSALLEVFIYENPAALMVPYSAVVTEDGRRFVYRRLAATGGQPASEKVEVQTGYTTMDAVEIVRGLNPGDAIVLR
jgi:HlyD family secretion protein